MDSVFESKEEYSYLRDSFPTKKIGGQYKENLEPRLRYLWSQVRN